MAKTSADDEELRRACQAAIEGSKQKIMISIRVAKRRGIWGKSGKLASYMAKPRVFALCCTSFRIVLNTMLNYWLKIVKLCTTDRTVQIQGIKTILLKEKVQVSCSYAITMVCAVKSEGHKTQAFLRVLKYSSGGVIEGFDNLSSQSIAPPQWTMRNIDDRNRILFCILNVCKEAFGRLPKVVGIDVVEMALWAKVTVEKDLISTAEEDDMEALLGSYVMGIGEAEAFSERLKRELLALEAANVHAMLESETLVEEVLQGLEAATHCVDDMDKWLGTFNVKLRRIREDIESIETRNNKLETQSVNNKALIQELDKLLERLCVPSEYATCLTGGKFDEARMTQNIEACEWLTGALRGLEVPNLDSTYGNMRARGQLKQPDHADLRYKCRIYAHLLLHLKSLDKNYLRPLRKAYCSSLNLLLRREAREFANELRASTEVSISPTTWLEGSPGGNQIGNSTDTSALSDAYIKMLTIFIPLLVDESSFLAHFMWFEVPALVPPGVGANGNKRGSNDDLGIMNMNSNDSKDDLQSLNESLQDLLDGIHEKEKEGNGGRKTWMNVRLLQSSTSKIKALFPQR
ncbi:hypothetical protein Gotri_010810 [Gossypium trilobum]|uniref:Exocyst complex component Sec3 coiled-coil domain-containing protein n=1 Tax=Gossypium trilobum TaxID=34281 RepID=A0A7J9ETA2_9ROSI|nr:hypothetical protein [Gossypium trilobum]